VTEHLIVTMTHRRDESGEVVHVSDEARELLVRAGWTPPPLGRETEPCSVASITLYDLSDPVVLEERRAAARARLAAGPRRRRAAA
jgi:hypothetical protein